MFEKIKEKLSLILSGLVAILGFLFFLERNKRKSLEVLDTNRTVVDQVNNIELEKRKNDFLLETQAKEREDIAEALKRELEREPTEQEVLDFFNKRYPN